MSEKKLFEPALLGGLELKNRIIRSLSSCLIICRNDAAFFHLPTDPCFSEFVRACSEFVFRKILFREVFKGFSCFSGRMNVYLSASL